MKKILITSGGTREYIDEVRVLTNISSGKLGALIADTIVMNTPSKDGFPGCHVHFVYVKGSETPKHERSFKGLQGMTLYEVTDVQSVYEVMEKLVPEMDVVIHPMAVSDFGFRQIDEKLKSNDPEAFIESLKQRIYQTPKILSHIKEWNPNCFLISFKFENGLNNYQLITTAFESMLKNNCDIVIANDKKEMKEARDHVSYFIHKSKSTNEDVYFDKIAGKENIAKEILNIINNGKTEL